MPRTVPDTTKGWTHVCRLCAEEALRVEVTYSRSLVRDLSLNSNLGVWGLVVN